MRLYLCRPARVEEVRVVRAGLRRMLRAVGASDDVTFQVLVACGEACGNAIRHPIEPSRAEFEVRATADREQVRVIVRDFGRWRDEPTRPGTGLELMRWLMDDVRLRATGRIALCPPTFVRRCGRPTCCPIAFWPSSVGMMRS